MPRKTKNVWLNVSLLIFVLGLLPFDASAQEKSRRLKLSILNVETRLSPSSIVRLRVDNLSGRTLSISQITLGMESSTDARRQCKGPCFFAHVPLKKKKLRKGQSVEVEARLDDRHWFYTNSQTFMYIPQPPNFYERFNSGDLILRAGILLPTDIDPFYEGFSSNEVIVHVE